MSTQMQQAVPDGYKLTEVGVIPEDWEVASLIEVSEKITDGTHDTPKPVSLGVPFLTAIHIKENKINFDSCYYLPQAIHDEIYRRCNPEKNDVLMVNIGAGVGTTALVDVGYEFSLKNVALIKPRKSKLIGTYLNYYQSYLKKNIVESLISGGAQPFLSLAQIGQLKVYFPSNSKEQYIIAKVLADVDELISSLEKLIAKRCAIKTAAMQQLLTGKKRLPPFDKSHMGYKQTELGEIPEDWEVVNLGTCLDKIVGGGTPSRSNASYWAKEIAWVTVKDFATFDSITAQEYISKDGLNNSASNLIPKGVLITSTRMALGKAVIYDIPVAINQDLKALFPSQLLNTDFLYYWFEDNKERIDELGSGSTVKGISLSDLKSIKLRLPPAKEQFKIAEVFSTFDNDLKKLRHRLSKVKQLKQGMMQELLTGKTRLLDGILSNP